MAAELVRFYFDPLCPWCYMTSRWAVRLEALGEIDVEWAVFSLEVVNLPEDGDPHDLEARSAPALRTAIAIRDTEGRRAIGRFYTALGALVWEHAPPAPHSPETVRQALSDAGLDPALCDRAIGDPGTWEAVLKEHDELVTRTKSFGVPTIVLDAGEGPAIFGPVLGTLPTDEEARELWHHVRWLMRYGNFSEVKRDRPRPPDLPVMEWYREQREKARAEAAEKAETT